MELKDYSTEELKAEKAKVKRCRMCKHWGEITYFGSPNNGCIFGLNRCCKFFKTKSGKYYRTHSHRQLACEYFEEKEKK